MPDEFYYMAIAGLGVSLAGFGGIIAALDRRPAANSPVAAWRIRNIAFTGFSLTFTGFGTVALYAVTSGDLTITVRAASLLLAAADLLWLRFETARGPAWTSEGQRRVAIATAVALTVATLSNVAYGASGFLQVLLLAHLGSPVSIFFNTVRDATSGE
ncbi:MAG TPA: hypothetical protein VKC59_07820 [Candidatus Limnocylindrales bacterium]|nr:hypothetical protein [Candidatus Limnocylindrales bacterium]